MRARLSMLLPSYMRGDNGVCEVLLKSVEWVNDKLGLERSLQFNELVTNQYEI